MNKSKSCPVSKKCSGCQLSNLNYTQQLEYKQKDAEKLLGQFGDVKPIVAMENPYNYRNKVQAVFRSDRNGRIISGVFQSSRNGIVGIDKCFLNDEKADEIVVGIRELMRSFKIQPYDIGTGRGFLRHVLVRVGRKSGEILVTLVGGNRMFPKKRDFVAALLKKFPEITTVTFSVNQNPEMLLLGENDEILFGKGYIIDELCGKRFRISPRSFYQINSVQTEKLYEYAIKAADLKKTDNILDAYSGIGTIGIIASDYVKSVQGIEYNAAAVRDAVKNCTENGITKNVAFNKGDAGDFLRDRAKNGTFFDVVFMDPARAGADRKFLSAITKIKPRKIVYISCNPATLSRDLKSLVKDYEVREIQPFDMFPHTRHTETAVVLERKDNQK
ncbi:MAG: 23S rRNA (uracil(1939)-C(5))-methyltransferase RlmD [Oscillospiraceae bacterium]|nr:23S rRNA (uracil(1939)-C(5))-methyltransferase RlmD [Oscillospiraceae bacterium]